MEARVEVTSSSVVVGVRVVEDLHQDGSVQRNLDHAAHPELNRSVFDDEVHSLEEISARPHEHHGNTE